MKAAALVVLLAGATVLAQDDDYLTWSQDRVAEVVEGAFGDGKVGSRTLLFWTGWDTRLLKTERAQNYKLRATWFTPDVVRASARYAQMKSRLSADDTRKLVQEAEAAGETVVVVDIDPNEGSGVVPMDWEAFLRPKDAPSESGRFVRGVIDSDDQCPLVPAGPRPDRARLGCPIGGGAPVEKSAVAADPAAGVQALGRLLTVMKPIFFKHQSATIEPKSVPVLEAVAAVLKGEPAIARLLVRGHTDSEGSEAYNQSLSKQRADAVMQWLTEHGVAGTRLEVKAFGPSLPYRNNRDARGRAQNRRVDFRIVDPQVSEADSVAAEDKAVPPNADFDDEEDEEDRPSKRRGSKNKKRKRTLDDMLDDVEKGRNIQ